MDLAHAPDGNGRIQQLRCGSVEIPPPPTSIQDWPVNGESVYRTWLQASTNIGALLARSSQQIIAVGGRLLGATGSALIGLLEFAGSIFVAGFLLAKRDVSAQAARRMGFLDSSPGPSFSY
jgi:hypothetical protein